MLDVDQVLNQVLDLTDPEAPALRVSGATGGGGGGGGEFPNLSSAPYNTVTVNSTADPLFAAEDDDRESAIFFNRTAERAYFGPNSSVTTTNFVFWLDQGQGMTLDRSDGFAKFRWHAVTAANSADIQVTEGVA